MKLDYDFSGLTLLKDWWKQVKSNFQSVEDDFNSHTTATDLAHPDKSVKQRHIGDKAVGTSQLADKAVSQSKIGDKAVSTSQIADNAVSTSQIADKAVGTSQIADYSVGATQLAQYSVSAAKIYPNAVQTAHIKDQNVTKAKLEQTIQTQLDDFQTHIDNPSAEIADNSVTNEKLGPGAVKLDNIYYEAKNAMLNYMLESENYDNDPRNNMLYNTPNALFKTFNSRNGTLKEIPSDTTEDSNGNVQYLLLAVPLNKTDRIQIAINTTSFRRFIRRVEGTEPTDWEEI